MFRSHGRWFWCPLADLLCSASRLSGSRWLDRMAYWADGAGPFPGLEPSFWTLVCGWAQDLGRPSTGIHSKWNPFVWLYGMWRALLRLDAWMYEEEYVRRINGKWGKES